MHCDGSQSAKERGFILTPTLSLAISAGPYSLNPLKSAASF